MIRIPVRGGSTSYDVLLGQGLLRQIGPLVRPVVRGRSCAILTDTTTHRLFANDVAISLCQLGLLVTVLEVTPGEISKSLVHVQQLADQMAEAGLDRTSFVITLGGGTIGDLGGFAAAVFHRGIPYVNVPTTLLAQVDSSIGGKTGVNLPQGKNLVGRVHQPVAVISDLDALEALPPRERRQGFAEIIKHAVIADASMLDHLEHGHPEGLTELVRRNIEIKARFVAEDAEDHTGRRALLNFGHTVGHGIEAAGDYRLLKHGECVSLGIVAACEISQRRFGFSAEEQAHVVAALKQSGLPTRLPREIPRERILPAIKRDKKFEDGKVRFIAVERLGRAFVTEEVTLDEIGEVIARL